MWCPRYFATLRSVVAQFFEKVGKGVAVLCSSRELEVIFKPFGAKNNKKHSKMNVFCCGARDRT